MIILLKDKVNENQVKNLTNWLESNGFGLHISKGQNHTIIGLIGDTSRVDIDLISSLDIVDRVQRIQEPFKSATRKFHADDTVIDAGGVKL
ncbi:MAG: 3-deoxy-7-phosphoheptulonate synthase, partial [Clostridia bacterium]|nr:3-deoxy-7-phosphoheptulonate synthase [Clostridia bacterium]